MTEKIKNIFIITLILLAIYQTTTLWLITIPTNNKIASFPELFTKNHNIKYENKESYFIPSKIVTNNNNKYYLQYSYLKDDKKLELIKNTLLITDSFKYSSLDYSILKNNFIALNFDFEISENTIEEALNIDLSDITNFYFDSIYLNNSNDLLNISLVNINTGEMYTSTIENYDLLETYYKKISSSNNALYYTLKINNNLLQFTPMWDSDVLPYKNVVQTNPYLTDGGLLKNNLTEKIKPLFDGSRSRIASTVDNNIVVISDAYNVAKYYHYDVLEYSNYRNYNMTKKSTPYEDYITAYEFILNDQNFNNEFYLSDYQIEDDKSTFYFDCVANNLPILLKPSEKENLGINSFVEVSIANDNVVYYKLLTYNYKTSDSSSLYNKNRLNNDLININYDDITMGYYLEDDDNLILYWLSSNDGNILMKSLK